MEWTVVSCVVFAIFLSTEAEPVVRSQDKPLSPDPTALYNTAKPDMQAALMLLKDLVKDGNTRVKDQVEELFSSLKEQLKQGDALTKEQVLEGLAHVKEQRKDGDERLKEVLDEEVAWLKDRLARVQRHFTEELAALNEELAEQREANLKLRNSPSVQPCDAVVEDLKQQMSDFQVELNSTQHKVRKTEQTLQRTQEQQQHEVQALMEARSQMQAAQEEIRSLTTNGSGSVFTRWGRTACPNGTSLVYSGVAGGSHYMHTGGGSNYLCLVMVPQMETMALPQYYSLLYGAEYENIEGHHDQDVVCSVCLTRQSTTLMIPATVTCPPGWSTQYRGHLMAGHHTHKGRAEHVCVDEDREHRQGGQGNHDGALFYHVVAQCGSLPCPPYVGQKVVTCVVCSVW
ncbi:uncharacterized protein LOC143293809 [Babylonia areolata]|uniref:uncharacterized protein LOC143293809 n=1 Tax=Babylonia areolata TaxID=304850 RepID=UPI003FD40932